MSGEGTIDELENLNPEEIQRMINDVRKEAQSLGKRHEVVEKEINASRAKIRDLISKIPEIQVSSQKRVEVLEKKRRLQRKILSLYTRFPGIINLDQPQFISTDIAILKRQLESINKREVEAEATISQSNKTLEQLTQRKIDLSQEDRLLTDLIHQRDQEKAALARSLKQELDSAKTLYISDIRTIDKKINDAQSIIGDIKSQLDDLKNQYIQISRKRQGFASNIPHDLQTVSYNIASQESLLLNKVENFISWWGSRRILDHYNTRKSFLKEVEAKTLTRVEDSYKSIDYTQKLVKSKKEELKSLIKLNDEISQSIKDKEIRKERLTYELESVIKSFIPLPENISSELEQLRYQYSMACNKSKSLDIEYRLFTDGSSMTERIETSLIDAIRDHYRELYRFTELQNKVDSLKKELEKDNLPTRSIQTSMSSFSDPRIIFSEDQTPVVVNAAPLELLCRLLFEPSNDDQLFFYSFLVLIYTEKFDLSHVIRLLINAYETCVFFEQRVEKMKNFIEIWHEWFEDDMKHIVQMTSLVSWNGTASLDRNTDSFVFDDRFQIDLNCDIAFSTSPYILAQHFFYVEMQIIRAISPSEFIGTGWSKTDKWTKTPNIMKLTDHFNTVSGSIVSSIISEKIIKSRTQLLEQWILIMDAARDIYEFQFVFEIYGALCNPAITRLKQTWEGVTPESKKIFQDMQSITSPMKQFAKYREILNVCPSTLAVPYIGPMLTQLVYTHDGNPAKKKLPGSGEEVLNFSKYRTYVSIMKDIIKPWGSGARYRVSKKLITRIKTLPIPEHSDSELYQKSLSLE